MPKRQTRIVPLGYKDNHRSGNGLDASDEDGRINNRTWPIRSWYEPDFIAAVQLAGGTYLVTANEGDPRDFGPGNYSEVKRVAELELDPNRFADAAFLQRPQNLGRLEVSAVDGAVPEWTEYRKKNGLDPLGMQNTSVGLYQMLLPGISNVTLRIRYYGLYAWLSSVYARQIGDTDPKTWQRFLRRAEALYALTAQHHGSETGVAGILWAQAKRAAAGSGEIAFADDAEPGSPTHYLKQAWGAYGAAYGSQLFEIGILSQAQGHVIPVPSQLPNPEVGEVVGNCFEKALDGIGPRFIETIECGTASLADLDAFAVMAPSDIGAESEERQLYEEILFARTTLQRAADLNRRKTLLLILNLAQQLGRPQKSWMFAGRSMPVACRMARS